MSSARDSTERFGVPPPQKNLARAKEMAFEVLARQADDQMVWLGAETSGDAWRVPALEDVLEIDFREQRVTTSAGREVGVHWTILVLHYLAVTSRPEPRIPAVTFADLAAARSYASVYQGRVIARLCATVGRDAEMLRTAVGAIGGRIADGGDAAFDFDIFPRVSLRLIWHAPDEEFGASATLLLPDNIESYFCSEDIVVLSECLVARLGGRPF